MPLWCQADVARSGVLCFSTSPRLSCRALDLKPPSLQPFIHEPLQRCEEERENSSNEETLTLVHLVKVCTKRKDLCKGRQLHADALKTGCFKVDSYVGNSLLYMYAKCGSLAKAQQIFDELPLHDVVSWTSLLSGYVDMGHGDKALDCFKKMQYEGHSPDAVAFACSLKACSAMGSTEKGKELHNQIVTNGFLGKDVILGSALVDMYVRFGELSKAHQVLDELPVRNVVTWNALITGYCRNECGKEVLDCFDRLKREGLSPTAVTFACILKACGILREVEKGKQLHAEIIMKGMLADNSVLGNALMDMYAKCGEVTKAQEVFDELPVWDIVSWTSLITGYCQHGLGEEALDCLEQMKSHGFLPNAITIACVLKVCGSIGAAEKGKELHAEIVRNGWLRHDTVLGNALVYMYAKCGILPKAQKVFDELPVRNLISWSSLISGYCEKGHGEEALNCFELMKHEGLSPDAVVFASILKACSTIGAVEKGQRYFEIMSTRYGIVPSFKHHTCLVDLLCQTGHFEKVVMVIKEMPSTDNLTAWSALLAACRKSGTIQFGELAFDHAAVQLDEKSVIGSVHNDVAITRAKDVAFIEAEH
ncbi:hypothetical protein GOP47_0021143 [Adiantum capillus-veneris]|uniref:Pentatricopeptide repeat-containing protein n=1 Tax=Adiantum capillus-veneris TaxID=13818 RepID=A0A9D4UBI6_ADICA|nr:hypothetical protein GOP47_0021143 [Adiantum capillus-veneris]